jgi:metal-dependent amidase/aminoacylase/carboxypeptidase family protein
MIAKFSVVHIVLLLIIGLVLVAVYAGSAGDGSEDIRIEALADNPSIVKRIAEEADKIYEEIVEIRHDLHKHPELSGKEERTSGVIAKQLKSMGLDVTTNVGGYGVVGVLQGKPGGPVVAYRADMDALPQNIREDVPYKSVHKGVSHACGHDVHVTVGLGIAKVLSSMKDEFSGKVKFIFQPAEENIQGARAMIAEGVLENPKPDFIFAVHVAPLEAGQIATMPGGGLPGYEPFTITLKGKENLKEAAKTALKALQAIGTVSFPRNMQEYEKIFRAMFQKESFLTDFVFLMIRKDRKKSTDEKTVISGALKAAKPEGYTRAHEQIKKVLTDLDHKDVKGDVKFGKRFPAMICDEEIAMEAIAPIEAILGDNSVVVAYGMIPFHGEDFALFLEKIPGAMFYLGGSNTPEGVIAAPHNPAFCVDEKALLVGVKGMTSLIVHYLAK